MCYSILECLLENLQSQLAALNNSVGQSCLKTKQTIDILKLVLARCPSLSDITLRINQVSW